MAPKRKTQMKTKPSKKFKKDEVKTAKEDEVIYKVNDLVAVLLDRGVWWPSYVKNISPLECAFWEEESTITVPTKKVLPFQVAEARGLFKRSKERITKKFKEQFERDLKKCNDNVLIEQAEGSGDDNVFTEHAEGNRDDNVLTEHAEGNRDDNVLTEHAEGNRDDNVLTEHAEGNRDDNVLTEHAEGNEDDNVLTEHAEGNIDDNVLTEHAEGNIDDNVLTEHAEGNRDDNVLTEHAEGNIDDNVLTEHAEGNEDDNVLTEHAEGNIDDNVLTEHAEGNRDDNVITEHAEGNKDDNVLTEHAEGNEDDNVLTEHAEGNRDDNVITEHAEGNIDDNVLTEHAEGKIDDNVLTEHAEGKIDDNVLTEHAEGNEDDNVLTEHAEGKIDDNVLTEHAEGNRDDNVITEHAEGNIDDNVLTEHAEGNRDDNVITEHAEGNIDDNVLTEHAEGKIDDNVLTEHAEGKIDDNVLTEHAEGNGDDNVLTEHAEWNGVDNVLTEHAEGNKRCRKNMNYSYFDKDTEESDNQDVMEDSFDDSTQDPDYATESSDEESIDHSDNVQDDAEYVSDTSDMSDTIPLVNTLPALCKPSVRSNTKNCPEINSSKGANGSLSQKGENPGIVIQMSNNTEEKRVWDKVHFCFFCELSSTNISKHYIGPHKSEPEVQKILSFPKKSKARKLELLKMRNAGDYKHNTDVLKNGEGILVTWARKSEDEVSSDDFLPCEDCLAFFLKSNLWRHRKVCPFRKDGAKYRKVQSEASFLLPSSHEVNKGLEKNVLRRMNADEITIAARNDRIITKVGEKLYQKHGHLPHLYSHVSQKMRELARLLIAVRIQQPDVNCLSDLLHPERFLLAVKATRILCNYSEDSNMYGNPSLALKIGHLLKKCAKIKKSAALSSGDSELGKNADEFLSLLDDEWTDDISSSALQTLNTNRMNKGQLLPMTEDLKKLQVFFEEKSNSLSSSLQNSFSKPEWELLNQLTLARLVMFNRRRGGETQRITLEGYAARLTKHDPLREIKDSLSPVEKMLCETFGRVEIRGKKGRTVPVLLTPAIQQSIDLLLKWRKEAQIPDNNPYLFARPNYDSLQPIRSSDVLRRFAHEPELELSSPENITSTKLRKHVATVSQILSLEENDLEVMATFMGHDIDVHRSFYRLPQETIQIARMGKLLSAFDNGTIGNYSGKKLDDITVEDIVLEVASEDEECDDTDDEDIDEVSPEESITVPVASASVASAPVASASLQEGKRRNIHPLTQEETNTLRRLFKTNVVFRRELKKNECLQAINRNPCLSGLDWKKVKNTVHSWIMLEKKKMVKLGTKK